ncbi:hypothetical protein [Paenibacillus macquariensis]|uniref:STAS/SEC14 domain-containing protein n=1 Tax=Paenibacillus macquariensis TaxID=948756 RepID=A0ABY1JR74_9BACL|nr:hypothetical protein [Paenibacillus macquariensis]MEC0092704.1 hypothetical protein [Paenibacillus macquariensis]OAB36637.1 hypothetical protein PMSM_06445 [Paenibacillus macquariensis subsp. macquariensis]SIQ64261.1 hypothetical protein SAMN05421578_103143 [Paenibacillus macquariensis]
MSTATILDRTAKIIEIVWDPRAKPEDFDRVTKEVQTFSQELGGSFDVIVDMRTVKAFMPESQGKLVEHQKALMDYGMKRAAVIVAGAIAKMQLKRTAKEALHSTESHWESYEEALLFLKNNH